MAAPKAGNLQSEITCSVCLELVNGTHERSTAKLICGHSFHLDCIGSAFNAKGSMQCPNCRWVEHGDWLYGNGCPHLENSLLDNMILEEEYDVELEILSRVSELVVPDDIWQSREEMDIRLELSIGYSPNTELVVGVLVGENLESTRSVQPSPYARAQALVLDRRARGVERNLGVAVASPARMQHAAAYQQHFSPIERRSRRQSPAAVEPNGVVGGVSVEEGSAGHGLFWLSGHDGGTAGGRGPDVAGTSCLEPHVAGRRSSSSVRQSLRRAESGRHARTTSAAQGAVREAQPRSNIFVGHHVHTSAVQGAVQPRSNTFFGRHAHTSAVQGAVQPRSSTFFGQQQRGRMLRSRRNPSEPEGLTRAPSVPFGVAYGVPVPSLQAWPLPLPAEDIDPHPSRSFYHPR